MAAIKGSKQLLSMLNEALAKEMAVSIQYMWQHILAKGMYSNAIGPTFRLISLQEMLHGELIAERLDYLGGKPTTEPGKINIGGTDPFKMLKVDVKAEEDAIALYKKIIKLADKEGDISTRKMMEDILLQEENHHNTFTNLIENPL